MSEWQKVKIDDFLKRIKRPVVLEDDKEYKLVTIQLHHKGVKLREYKKGGEIKSNMHEVKAGDFILSGIDARNGAFGIVGDELNGAIVTNDFWYFELNEELIDKHFFLELTSTKWFDEICRLGSDGTTQRIRLQKSKFFDQEIYLPSVEKQKEVSKKFISIKQKKEQYKKECSFQKSHLTLLRQQILQDAISGKLTADWRAENPDIEAASKLLEQIKAEKEKLIAEKKIKKEKHLPEISEAEMPFELPEKWEWCRPESLFTVLSSKGKQLKSKEYKDCGQFPIIDQGKSFICGYSDQEKKLVKINRPLIIFGDHTREVKFVDFDFIVGADGTKILNPIGDIFEKYLFFALKGLKINSRGYGRHFKILKNSLLPLPPLAEQKVIVAKIEKLMEHVSKLEEKIKQNKQDAEMLMQSFLVEAFKN